MNFLDTYLLLERLEYSPRKRQLTEAKYFEANPINLADCRMITSDVKDIRGEYEASACLEYNGELTRVQCRTVIIRETEKGKEFLGKAGRTRIRLPGGGFDANKDSDILDTAEREAYEEFNLVLTNLKDTGIHIWSSRRDPWVIKHVANEEDRWTGYYTWYAIAEVKSIGDNDRPEEINRWQWLPIERLVEVNAKLPAFVDNLNEAIHPDKEGKVDENGKPLGNVSYLCDSLSTLRKILSRMEIQKTYVSEVRWEPGERPIDPEDAKSKTNTQRVKQMSLSTSTDITGHAARRADKWGFGVLLDGYELSKYYDIEHYNHADHKLLDLHITKIVRVKPGAVPGGRVIIGLGEYGNRIISAEDDADLELYSLLMTFLEHHPQWEQTAMTLETNYVSTKSADSWAKHPFGYEKNIGWCDTRFTDLTPDQIETIHAWKSPASKNAIPIKAIAKFDKYMHQRVIDIFKGYTSFDEAEERIWLPNNLMNFIQIPKSALKGIILPRFFEADYESQKPLNYHLAWLKRFVSDNNLSVTYHDYSVPNYYNLETDQLNANNTIESENAWKAADTLASNPSAILHTAFKLRQEYCMATSQEEIDMIKEREQPISVIATAAVKLALKKWMPSEPTPSEYRNSYNVAFAAASDYFIDALLPGKKIVNNTGTLTQTGVIKLKELFDYYCPDAVE